MFGHYKIYTRSLSALYIVYLLGDPMFAHMQPAALVPITKTVHVAIDEIMVKTIMKIYPTQQTGLASGEGATQDDPSAALFTLSSELSKPEEN